MPAPKGNKYALGNKGGKPRVHDRVQIAKDLIEWAQKKDSTNLCGFCAENMLVADTVIRWAQEDEEFRRSYTIAKQWLGVRREKMLAEGKLHVRAYERNVHVYDVFAKKESRDEKKFDAELTKEIQKASTDDIEQKMLAIHSQLEEARKLAASQKKN